MTQKYWLKLGPGLVVGAGIVASTFVTVRAAEYGWLVMAGPSLLALAIVTADLLGSRMRGGPPVASPAALLLGGAVVLASLIVTSRDPHLVKTLFPMFGVVCWIALPVRVEGRRKTCGNV